MNTPREQDKMQKIHVKSFQVRPVLAKIVGSSHDLIQVVTKYGAINSLMIDRHFVPISLKVHDV